MSVTKGRQLKNNSLSLALDRMSSGYRVLGFIQDAHPSQMNLKVEKKK